MILDLLVLYWVAIKETKCVKLGQEKNLKRKDLAVEDLVLGFFAIEKYFLL